MLKVDKQTQLQLWKSQNFFTMLDYWLEDELDEFQHSRESLAGTTISRSEIGQNDDRSGCYILFFRGTSDFYVGSAIRLAARVSVHMTMLRGKKHFNEKLQDAYERNGNRKPEVFYLFCHDRDHSRDVEQRLIDLTFDDPYSLNQQQMVNEYRPSTEETRAKLKQAAFVQWKDPDFLERIERVYQDPNVIARKKAAAHEVSKRPGYRKKLSEASKETWKDPEYAAAQKVSGAKIWKDEEFRKRHAGAMTSHWSDPEYKARVVKSMQRASEAKQRPVVINEVRYATALTAAKELGLGEGTIRRRCESDKEEYIEWNYVK